MLKRSFFNPKKYRNLLFNKHITIKTLIFLCFFCAYCLAYSQCPSGNLTINNQAEADSFVANYPNCTTINGNLTINGVTTINLTPFNNLITINGDLIISGTNVSNTLNLNNITTINGNLNITYNLQLENLNGLENLNSIGLDLWLESNDNMVNLNGINNLNTIGQNLIIDYNLILNSLNGLNNLATVTNNVVIYENNELTNFDGISNLVNVYNGIYIGDGTAITSITGLENINPNNLNMVSLVNMPNVSTCALQNICNYLQNGGASNIYGNNSGCNSDNQILDACNNLSIENVLVSKIRMYPNPSSNYLYINSLKNIKASVLNINGQELLSGNIDNIIGLDISKLSNGTYILTLEDKRNQLFIKYN